MTEQQKKKLEPDYQKICADLNLKNMTGNQSDFVYHMLQSNTFGISKDFATQLFDWKKKNGN